MLSSQLFKMNMSNLTKLGYKTPELQWLNSANKILMSNKYNNNTLYHKHFADLSYDIKYQLVFNNLKSKGYMNEIYTTTLITSILHYGFDSWATFNVHLDYQTILGNFYLQKTCVWSHTNLDNVSLGNKLLSHQFIEPMENKQLQHFRSIQRESKICTTDIYQLMMSVKKDI